MSGLNDFGASGPGVLSEDAKQTLASVPKIPHRRTNSPSNLEEDGTKISELSERRRVQNRIAVRSWPKKIYQRLNDPDSRAGSSSATSFRVGINFQQPNLGAKDPFFEEIQGIQDERSEPVEDPEAPTKVYLSGATSGHKKSASSSPVGYNPSMRQQSIDKIERSKDHIKKSNANSVDKNQQRGTFTQENNRILRDWMYAHNGNCSPSHQEKTVLECQTGLNITQIENWVNNALRKPKVGGKTPKLAADNDGKFSDIMANNEPLIVPPADYSKSSENLLVSSGFLGEKNTTPLSKVEDPSSEQDKFIRTSGFISSFEDKSSILPKGREENCVNAYKTESEELIILPDLSINIGIEFSIEKSTIDDRYTIEKARPASIKDTITTKPNVEETHPDVRWTNISGKLVSLEALELRKEIIESWKDDLLRVTSKKEVRGYAKATQNLRAHESNIPADRQLLKQSNEIFENHSSIGQGGNFTKEDDSGSDTRSNYSVLSILSLTESVFSLPSEIAGSSASSLHTSQDAIERLVQLFLEDAEIREICLAALVTLPRERFERNLRRLLKRFAGDLRKEAKTEHESNTARFVSHRATNSAHLICNKLDQKWQTPSRFVVKEDAEELSEDGDSDQSESMDNIQQLEVFIRTSKAIAELRNALKDFVQRLIDIKEHLNPNPDSSPTDTTLVVSTEDEGRASSDSSLGNSNVGDVSENLNFNENSKNGLMGRWCSISVSSVIGALDSLKRRPIVRPGQTRIEWRCKCGHSLYDDFVELQPGAAEILKRQLDHTTNGERRLSSTFQGLLSLLGLQTKQGTQTELPIHENKPTCKSLSSSTSASTISEAPVEMLFLLLCYNEGHYATRLLQLDLVTQKTTSDKTLFKTLRQNYKEMRGKWIAYFSLRTLQSIKFVNFEMYRSELVDVRKQDDIPPPNHAEYRYQPAPPELIPPIGERHLMHLFEHPDHAEDETVCLDRFPKKLKERLKCKGGVNPGWGLQLVEGIDMRKTWAVIFILFGGGSLLTGVLWAIYNHSTGCFCSGRLYGGVGNSHYWNYSSFLDILNIFPV